MKRHLKIRGELHGNDVTVTVLEQTHRAHAFSKRGNTGCYRHGEIILVGLDHNWNDGFDDITAKPYKCVLLSARTVRKPFKVPLKYWPEVKAAVESYNEWGAKNGD